MMSDKKKALIFIDHDLLIRHFIHSGVFREIEDDFDVTYVFHTDSTTDKAAIYTDVSKLNVGRYLRFEIPRKRMGTWYHLYAATVLRRHLGKRSFTPRRKTIAATVGEGGNWRSWVYAALGLPGLFQLFRYFYLRRMGVYAPLRELIMTERPEIVFCPSILSGYFINEIGPITREFGIPFVALMNSFDNPSQKAVCTELPDKLVVWGPQTRDHAVQYMGMPAKDVEVFGAAQFQIYRKPVTETRAELCAIFGVPSGLPIVLYGGVSKGVDETRHLKLLDEAIAKGEIAPCHILYRPHPWRTRLSLGEQDFFGETFAHVSMDPHMADYYRGIVKDPSPILNLADYDVTRKLMALISAAISPLSTLMLEAMMHRKPVLSFFSREDIEKKYGDAADSGVAFRLAHFDGFFDAPGVHRCSDAGDLANAVNRLLVEARDPAIAEALGRHAARYVIMDGPTYGQRLRQLAARLTSSRSHSEQGVGAADAKAAACLRSVG